MLGTADDPIRVLRVIARLNVGGPSLHVSYLSEGLAERGYLTTLAAGTISEGEASMAFVAERRGVEIESIQGLQRELSPREDAAVIMRLREIIRRDRPHVLHTHTAKAGTVGRIAARLAGDARPPVVVHTFHGHNLKGQFDPARTRAFATIERGLARTTDALVAVSPEVRDELVEAGVAPATRFAVVRLGIDLSERMAGASGGAALRASLAIPTDRFCVGWVARMTAVKQPEDVLGTMRQLRDRGVDAALILVGDGPERAGLEARARELGLDEGLYFVGFQNDVGPWFHAFDAMLLTSRSEGTPVSAIEALASGRPVVATDVGGTRDVVADGISGFLVPFGDVASGAERLSRLALDPGLRAQMGAAGQASTQTRYAVPRLVGDIDRLYRSLLQAKGIAVMQADTPPTAPLVHDSQSLNDAHESELQLRVLEALESAHHYNSWVAELTLPYLGDDPLEIGSGIGVSAELWLGLGIQSIRVTELDPTSLARLHERFQEDDRVTVTAVDSDRLPESRHSSVVALNVLEHIADDAGALRSWASLVRPNGRIVIFVPAFPFAAGKFDRQIGHYRRYTLRSAAEAFRTAGIELESARYVNAPGLAAWFLGVRLLGRIPRDGRLLRTWDALVVPVVRKVEARWAPPFGQSVLAVGRVATAS